MEYQFTGLNDSLIGLSRELKKIGIERETRGFRCFEFPEPVIIKTLNPTDRYMAIKERKGNKFLPFVETLWILLGINDLEMPGAYVNNLYTFSDDGQFMRAGYGPRIRAFSGLGNDYKISKPTSRNVFSGNIEVVDQLKYVVESFKRDINTRQAIIEIGDPAKDSFNKSEIKQTKDYPCTRLLNFMVRNGKLDLTLYIRSNDLIWGYSSVNFTNFTLIQEVVANLIGVPVGNYYHVANNLHYYERHEGMLETLANLDNKYSYSTHRFEYEDKFKTITNLDTLLLRLYGYEHQLRNKIINNTQDFGNDFINDWAKVFYHYWTKNPVVFKNPYLNILFS